MHITQHHTSSEAPLNAPLSQMHVEIWSDVVCPFCYIGKRRFEEALRNFPYADRIMVTWKSFQLDPTISSSLHSGYAEYLASRKGMSLSHVQQMFANVAAMGDRAGVILNFDKAIIANSYNAHRILHLAQKHGVQNAMKEALLKAHFTEGLDINSLEILSAAGISIGLDAEEVREMLAGNTFVKEVREDIQEAQQLGIQGVPFFVFNRQYAVSGAQETQVFAEVLQQSFEEWSPEHDGQDIHVTEGETCTPEGLCA